MTTKRRDIPIRVHYPLDTGRLTIRTDIDWDKDLEPRQVSAGGDRFDFLVRSKRPFVYFKPVLRTSETRWAKGSNYLALAGGVSENDFYPSFAEDECCSVCELREIGSRGSSATHAYRVFLPPRYGENHFKCYPVLYMQDGQNLFFPDEAFRGHDWRVDETVNVLGAMNAIEEVIVVGIYPEDRIREYTKPGYEAYGRFLVEDLKPAIDNEFRVAHGADRTAIMGSSLGGVASFHTAWQWPEVFGMTASLSSTFGYRDDLAERVAIEPRRDIRIYLDSGWPEDNYEVTRGVRALLAERGYRQGIDLHYLAFPHALHTETAWATRVHIPFQLFFGR